MSKVQSVLGYILAVVMVPLVVVTFMGMPFWSELLVSGTGLTVSPWFTGGEVASTVDHGRYQTRIHYPVFDALIGERREGFVQIDWTPIGSLPEQIDEEIDFDADGQADFRVVWDVRAREAELTPYTPQVLGVEGIYRLDYAWAIRVGLRNAAD